jgi:tetratricopeptide (TPR) repeat protein
VRSSPIPCSSLLLAISCAGLIGCGGVSPDPAAMARDLPTADPSIGLDDRLRPRRDEAIERAWRAEAEGRFETARDEARTALRIDEASAEARAVLGLALAGLAQRESPPDLALWRRAEGELRRALALAPDDLRVGLAHVRFLETEGHLAAAAEHADRMVASYPSLEDTPGELLRRAGRLHDELGEEQAALPLLTASLADDPTAADVLFRIAWCTATLAERAVETDVAGALWRDAAIAFEAYAEVATYDVEGPLGAGHAWLQVLDVDAPDEDVAARARAAFTEALSRNPDSADALHGRGVLAERLGDLDGALADYGAALARDREHAPTLLDLLALRAESGTDEDLEIAENLAERVLTLPPQELTVRERERVAEWLAERRAAGQR